MAPLTPLDVRVERLSKSHETNKKSLEQQWVRRSAAAAASGLRGGTKGG
jgi:hypothetical protein